MKRERERERERERQRDRDRERQRETEREREYPSFLKALRVIAKLNLTALDFFIPELDMSW